MLISIILSYLPYALVTSYTPGPNNILALYAVSSGGWKKGKNTVLGICLGFLCVMVICALLCYTLAMYIPALSAVMHYVGVVYIVWLGIHVALSSYKEGQGSSSSFLQGFLLQFVNAKIILYALTINTGYVLTVTNSPRLMLINAFVLTIIGTTGFVTWAAAGGLLQKFLYKYYKPFNIIMGGILVLCGIKLLFE